MSSNTGWHSDHQSYGNIDEEELLVFGYSCKIFRDDEKAIFIDEGKHLIPWMGDESLMIDRYDVRGYLHDLAPYEAKPHYELDQKTIDEEALCDEERYSSLRRNLTEEELYHEEELKRLKAALASEGAYHEIGFSYDSAENTDGVLHTCANKEEPVEDPYTVPTGLTIPKGMQTPFNMKIHAIIEKTACFIAQQGGQMEIIIKMKQSDNPQFAFMNFDDPLHPYYKFLMQEIKAKRYTPILEKKPKEVEEDHNEGHYLHPSLVSRKTEDIPKFTVPSINFRRTGDDSYSLLVKNLKQRIDEDIQRNSPSRDNATDSPLTIGCQYLSSDSDTSDSDDEMSLTIPPPELRNVVDKMAEYVAKNGEDFETIVKSKNDKRFQFLVKGNKYYNYYNSQRQMALRRRAPKQQLQLQSATPPPEKMIEQKSSLPSSASNSPVSTVSEVPVLPGIVTYDSPEHSRDSSPISESEALPVKTTPCSSKNETPETQSPSSIHSIEPDITAETSKSPPPDVANKESSKIKTKVIKGPISFSIKAGEQTTEKVTRRSTLLLEDDSEEGGEDEEHSDTSKKHKSCTDQGCATSSTKSSNISETEEKPEKPRKTPEELEAKLAEEKLKDKIMAAAREKLLQQKRMQQLQQERKQKAALFLEMLRNKKLKSAADKKARKNGDASDSSSSSEATPPDKNEPISSFPPSPISVFCQSGHWSGSEASDNEASVKTVNRLQTIQSSSSNKEKSKSKEKVSSRERSHKSHKSSKSKKRRRSGSRSKSHSHKKERIHSSKEKKLPAAYAIDHKSRSNSHSPKRHNLHFRSRSPLRHWSKYR